METIAVVTADAKSRISLRGVVRGQRFVVSMDGETYVLKPVKEGAFSGSRVVREKGRLVVDTGRPISRSELAKALEDYL